MTAEKPSDEGFDDEEELSSPALDYAVDLVAHKSFSSCLAELLRSEAGVWIDVEDLYTNKGVAVDWDVKRVTVAWVPYPKFEKDYRIILFFDEITQELISATLNNAIPQK